MQRRVFMTIMAGATVVLPMVAHAQRSPRPVVGYLNGGSPEGTSVDSGLAAFKQGLQQSGFVESETVDIEYRWAQGHYDRLPGLASELVQRNVTVIAATGTPAALAAKAATSTLPIVFETAGDPIALGLVTRMSRPGRNLTGVTQLNSELVAKRVELLRDLIPAVKVIGFLVNPKDARADTQSTEVLNAAQALGLQIRIINTSIEPEIEAAFSRLAETGVSALIVGTGEFFTRQSGQIIALAEKHRIPTVYQYRFFVTAGGLMSFGASLPDAYRLAGVYTARILKGEKPGDLPITQPSAFELVLNLKAAAAIGVTVPREFVLRADEVIQ